MICDEYVTNLVGVGSGVKFMIDTDKKNGSDTVEEITIIDVDRG
jgi:hypothetical protein